jgi:hypothetical protein
MLRDAIQSCQRLGLNSFSPSTSSKKFAVTSLRWPPR